MQLVSFDDFADNIRQETARFGRENNSAFTEHENPSTSTKNITHAIAWVILETYWCGREDLKHQDPQVPQLTDRCPKDVNDCLSTANLCHNQEVTAKSKAAQLPNPDKSLPLSGKSLSMTSAEPLQNFDRTSNATISQSPDLKRLIAAWPTLPLATQKAILGLINSSFRNPKNRNRLLATA